MKIKWNSEQIPKMNVKNNKDVTFLTYPAYEEMNWLVHGFSTRFGDNTTAWITWDHEKLDQLG